VQVDLATLMVPTIVQGAAVACFFIPLVSITLSGLPPDKIASASGLSNFVRITAGAFGTSISTTVWDDRATMHHAHLAEAIHQGNTAASQTLSQLQAAGMSASQALANLDRIVTAQAYVLSADDVFYASALIFLALLPLIWLAKRPKAVADAGGAH
jgi:DHA2 family multidrug resistance protein